MRKAKVLNYENLNVLSPNIIDNDLLYISSVLNQVDRVISKTYGPYSGYVANIERDPQTGQGAVSYTKDGQTTLNLLSFNQQIDVDILNMVRRLAHKIKSNSGDGSTTGAKVLANMIRFSAEDILEASNKEGLDHDLYRFRITAPKAIEYIIKELYNVVEKSKKKVESTKDILDVAYIALNNDKSLLNPFKEIVEHMEANNIPLNEDLEIGAFRSLSNDTTVEINPGFNLGTQEFSINNSKTQMDNCKIIMLSNRISLDYIRFILPSLMQDAITYSNREGIKIVFICAGLEYEAKSELKKILKRYEENKKELNCDFIEIPYVYDPSDNKKEDLSYYLSIDTINLFDYIEKRDTIVIPEIDRPEVSQMMKWKVTVDEDGKVLDDLYGIAGYLDAFHKQLEKGLLCNIRRIPQLGLCVTPASGQKLSEFYYNHIESLRKLAESSKDKEIADMAKARLFYLKEAYYAIYVGNRISDGVRLYTAYRDAVRAVNSMLKDGYHMGGNIGAIDLLTKMYRSKAIRNIEDSNIRDTALYIINLIKEAFESSIDELLLNETYENALNEGIINPDDMTYYDTKVIIPIETDKTIIENTIYQFSNIFSSLILELDDPMDAIYVKRITKDIKDKISGNYVLKDELRDTTPKLVLEDTPIIVEEKKENSIINISPIAPKEELPNTSNVEVPQNEQNAPLEELKDNTPINNSTNTIDEDRERFLREKEALEKEAQRALEEKKVDDYLGYNINDLLDENGNPIQKPKGNVKEYIESLKNAPSRSEAIGTTDTGIKVEVAYNSTLVKDLDVINKIKKGEDF